MRQTLYIVLILGSLLVMSAFLLLVGGQLFGTPAQEGGAPYPTFPEVIPPGPVPPGAEPERPRLFGVDAVGGKLEVYDFRALENSKGLPPGMYLIAGKGVDDPELKPPTESFQIMFTEFDQQFTITLLREPIGTVRRAAETELLSILRITERDACRLRVLVTAPYWLSEVYVGKNLGLSFCDRSVTLPE